MNCGNLGEGCGRRDFPGDPNNIYCLTSIEFLKQSVQQCNQIMSAEKNTYIVLMVKKFNIRWIHAIDATFLTRIYIAAFVFEFCKSALTNWLLCKLYRALAFHFWHHHFGPKLASSILNFCRWKRSFQWYPDQSAQPEGAWDMHKTLSEKFGAKFPGITRCYSKVKFGHLD